MAAALMALGVAGQAYGAATQPNGFQPSELPLNYYDPGQDPLLAALSMNAGAGVGTYDPSVYAQASPVQQVLARLGAQGTTKGKRFNQLREMLSGMADNPGEVEAWIQYQKSSGDPATRKTLAKAYPNITKGQQGTLDKFNQLLINEGYKGIEDLMGQESAYKEKGIQLQAQYQPVADQMRKGLLASQGRIGQYLQDLPNLLTGEANPFIDQLRQEALISSQKYGTNPYQGLEQARSQALQRALQLIQGEQSVQAGQEKAALPIAQLRQQGNISAAQIGAGQAQMLMQSLQSREAAQSAKSQAWGNLGSSLMGAGAGLAGAGGGGGMYGGGGMSSSPTPGYTNFNDPGAFNNNVSSGWDLNRW